MLSNLVANGTVNLKRIDFLIIHVGSNNIAIHQSVNQIISFYGDLIHYIKCKTSAQIVFTYLGIEAERIVPIFLLKTPGNIYKYKHLNI
jgi:hypothetical protein